MLPLIGVALVIVGFILRFNPLLVVTCAGLVTGLAAGKDPVAVVSMLGRGFTENRFVAVVWLLLPVIGLLERAGLKERSQELIARMRAATPGRVLLVYLVLRQVTSALGLTSLGGHAQMVRPLLAPMAEGAAASRFGTLAAATRYRIRAWAASADNVGFFFGEDIFIAIGAILLMKGVLEQNGIIVEPVQLSVWAIPTAIAAFLIHGTRLLLFDRWLAATARDAAASEGAGAGGAGVASTGEARDVRTGADA